MKFIVVLLILIFSSCSFYLSSDGISSEDYVIINSIPEEANCYISGDTFYIKNITSKIVIRVDYDINDASFEKNGVIAPNEIIPLCKYSEMDSFVLRINSVEIYI